jgi:iron complex transport system permease protein
MKPLTARGYWLRILACLIGVAGLLVASPGIGTDARTYRWRDVWRAALNMPLTPEHLAHLSAADADADGDGVITQSDADSYRRTAVLVGFELRLPRSLLALVVGITLALCGATFQVLFRNPLATPYTLGVVSGGALGAFLAMRLGWQVAILGVFSTLAVAAFGGGVAVVAVVFFIARGARRLTSNEILLAGVTIGLFCSAMNMVLMYLSNERETFQMVQWMMGSLDTISNLKTATMLPLVVPAWIVLIACGRGLNQYRLGDELAASRGVNLRRLESGCVLVSTLATGAVVAHCGPIGFVGLVVPHIVVLLFGSDCRIVLPASALMGGAFLILCDWLSQVAMRMTGWASGRELGSITLPIGVVTAVVGVPVFLVLLRTRRAA